MANLTAADYIKLYTDAKSQRSRHEPDWRLASAHCLPRQYSAWQTEGPTAYVNGSMAAARRVAYDTTAMRALPKFMAVLERICTPHNMRWQRLAVTDRSLARNPHVRNYFDILNDQLFAYRYESKANFIQASSEVYSGLGVYGNAPIYYGQRSNKSNYKKKNGFLYKACGLRDVFILVDDEGCVSHTFRRMFFNYRQFKMRWPEGPVPKCFAAQEKGTPSETTFYEFVHIVCLRQDYDDKALGVQRHPYMGVYISVADNQFVGEEQGFRSNPYLFPRIFTEADNPYGSGVAAQALPAMGTASQIKKTVIKQGQKAVDPVILTHDDGVMNGQVDLRPGAQNPGGLNRSGQELVKVLPTGDFKVSDMLLKDERDDINDAFFVKLFQIFTDLPEMTAEQSMQRLSEVSTIVAPVMGRIQSEFTGPGTERELDMLAEMGVMPPMPPELVEAKGDYQIVYTSPMAMGMYMEEVSGFIASVNDSIRLVEATQDPSYLDHYNFDAAIPEMAEFRAVPARWMNDANVKAKMGANRAQQQQQQQLIQNAANLSKAAQTAQQMQGPASAQMPAPGGQVPQQLPPLTPPQANG